MPNFPFWPHLQQLSNYFWEKKKAKRISIVCNNSFKIAWGLGEGKGFLFNVLYWDAGRCLASVRYRTICICVYIYYFHVICKTEISNELSMWNETFSLYLNQSSSFSLGVLQSSRGCSQALWGEKSSCWVTVVQALKQKHYGETLRWPSHPLTTSKVKLPGGWETPVGHGISAFTKAP